MSTRNSRASGSVCVYNIYRHIYAYLRSNYVTKEFLCHTDMGCGVSKRLPYQLGLHRTTSPGFRVCAETERILDTNIRNNIMLKK